MNDEYIQQYLFKIFFGRNFETYLPILRSTIRNGDDNLFHPRKVPGSLHFAGLSTLPAFYMQSEQVPKHSLHFKVPSFLIFLCSLLSWTPMHNAINSWIALREYNRSANDMYFDPLPLPLSLSISASSLKNSPCVWLLICAYLIALDIGLLFPALFRGAEGRSAQLETLLALKPSSS